MSDPGVRVLNAVLVGTLLIGTSLPFDTEEAATLWDGPPVAGAAAARLAAVLLIAVLIACALVQTTLWSGLAQLGASAVLVGAAVHLANATDQSSGPGATLVTVTALVSAVVGLAAACLGPERRRT